MQLIRILSAQPKPDASGFVITAAFHRDEWYETAYGQNPVPFYRNPYNSPPARPPYPWRPGNIAWGSSDAVFPHRLSFGLTVSPTSLDITGKAPVNSKSPANLVNAPSVPLQATTSSTGGTIKPGTYLIAFTASSAGPVSNFITAVVPAGTNTNTITVSGIFWANGIAETSVPYVGEDSLHMRQAGFGTFTSGTPDGSGNPTSFTFSSISVDGSGLPDIVFNSMLIEGYDLIHGGVWGDSIGSVSGGGATWNFPAASWTTNQWAGYTVALYYHPSAGPQAAMNVKVASNTANALTLTAIPPFGSAGDVVVMRPNPGSITANTIGDANFINGNAPSGLTVNAESGNLLWIIAGTGAGMPPYTIASNTSTVLTISGTWYVTPDSTSVFIITGPRPRYEVQTNTISNDGSFSPQAIGSIPLTSFGGGSLWIGCITLDSGGNPSPERYAPFREVWAPPQSVTSIPSLPFTVPVSGGTATPDASAGDNLLVLTAANTLTDGSGNKYINVAAPVNYATGAGVYTKWTLIVQQDPTTPSGGYATIFDPSGHSYKLAFSVATNASPAATQCHIDFKTDSSGVTTPVGPALIDQPIS